ncbi:MAG TPA: hypothetical protein VFH94_22960 [Streptomyces sp.]|nr:hypothetical protein [Streptomyces sp.]
MSSAAAPSVLGGNQHVLGPAGERASDQQLVVSGLGAGVSSTAHLEELLDAVSALGSTTTSIVLTSPVGRKVMRPLA